ATIGKAMMDYPDPRIPEGLRETTAWSLEESARLCASWHGAAGGRLRYAYAPRFAVSCTDDLLRETSRSAREAGVHIHTHASENRDEIAEVERRTGLRNVLYLHDCGLTGNDVGLAHCVWLDDAEKDVLAQTGTHVLHCPSSNLKLASGIAEIPELLERGISVSLGADGAPCNNNLDAFLEMRLAALIHKPRRGERAMRAARVLQLATIGGAAALGLQHSVGSLEVGKLADIAVVDISGPHVAPTSDPHAAIVYGCRASDVRHVVVDGRVIVRDRTLLTLEQGPVLREARERARRLFDGIS
ncbi:MAG TPA: amidohydrolase family protein, partial [Kofleriaceae bacterium]|nr:amidohydrolase family protein [Kofleriaceae bacterium]